MPTVYVIQQPKKGPRGFVYDISPAMQYGTIQFIFDADDQPGLRPKPAAFAAQKRLRDFNPAEDFVLWAGGDPASLAIAMLALAKIAKGLEIKFLRWERERMMQNGDRTGRGYYVPVSLSV